MLAVQVQTGTCVHVRAPRSLHVEPVTYVRTHVRRKVESVACMLFPKPHHVGQVPLEGGAHVRTSQQVCGVSQVFHCARCASFGSPAKYVRPARCATSVRCAAPCSGLSRARCARCASSM